MHAVMELSRLMIALTAFYSNCNAITWEHRTREVDVTGSWQKILDHDNHNSQPAKYSETLTRGFKSTDQRTDIVRAQHHIGTTITAGRTFKIVKVSASFTYGFTHTTETISMQSSETTNTKHATMDVTVPPRSHLIRWQLVADVGGYDIGFHRTIDSLNSSFVPPLSGVTVKAEVVVPRAITLCETPFRIKHLTTGKYITVTTRKYWPAATLGWANYYYFKICSTTRRNQFRVHTLNSTYENYNKMYTSRLGGIYFDLTNSDCETKDLWELSRQFPLHDNDVITFRNVNWPTAYLCDYNGWSTSVYCLNQQEDHWILEI